jgi:hypothetical protein
MTMRVDLLGDQYIGHDYEIIEIRDLLRTRELLGNCLSSKKRVRNKQPIYRTQEQWNGYVREN